MKADTLQTIAVRCRRPGRILSRLRIEYPPLMKNGAPMPPYDPQTARQLLILTGELPTSKRGLLIVLAEHRRAIADHHPAPDASIPLPSETQPYAIERATRPPPAQSRHTARTTASTPRAGLAPPHGAH